MLVLARYYLSLAAQEMKQYERELAAFEPGAMEATMEIVTSWHKAGITEGVSQGISQGIAQGKETLVERLLRRRHSAVSEDITKRLSGLSPEQLDELGEAILDFQTPADLETWLARN